jgi:flagellar biosynthetic protein FliR
MVSLDAAALEQLFQLVVLGGLAFVRVSALFLTAPVLSHGGLPPLFRASLALVIVVGMLPALPPQPPLELHPWVLLLLALKEAAVGALIGFLSAGVLSAARFAGGLLDMDIGFQTALLFDPNLGGFPTLVGEFFAFAALMLFFGLGGMETLPGALTESIRLLPLTVLTFPAVTPPELVRWVGALTALAVSIAAPVMAALFVSLWGLALLARTAPQINIFMLSFSLKAVIGIGMLFVSVPLIVMLLRTAVQVLQQEILLVVRTLAP